jgi:hypothetical protein
MLVRNPINIELKAFKIEASLMKRERVEPLLKEAGELTAIFARSIYTARKSK